MGIVSIKGQRVYAYHGCLEEEALVGTEYRIDVDIHLDFTKASISDDLTETADYVVVAAIVKEEMAIRSKLIEQVAYRIIGRIRGVYPKADKVVICLQKINPPAGADLDYVSVTLEG
ncbi:MAG: dihydroneopterin aldolase [Flavobacteriales bacterium]|nr:dihydroneopterin aldolase [Flavobacteriales bacterium]